MIKNARLLLLCFLLASCAGKLGNEEGFSLTETNKQLVLDYYEKVVFGGKVELIDNYIADGYIQHSPVIASGKQAVTELIRDVIHAPGAERPFGEIVRVIAEDDLVMLHVRTFSWPDKNGTVIVDLFRVEDGKIVEHWDVIQPVPAEKSVNGNTVF